LHPYTVIPTLLGSDYGVLGHTSSRNDAITSWLELFQELETSHEDGNEDDSKDDGKENRDVSKKEDIAPYTCEYLQF
jgi:hypothetical protein